jgi:hypothetical protein
VNTFTLSASGVSAINAPVTGNGGFQTFMRRLQRGLHGRRLTLSDSDLGRAVRHLRYGGGGYQDRIHEALGDHIVDAVVGA